MLTQILKKTIFQTHQNEWKHLSKVPKNRHHSDNTLTKPLGEKVSVWPLDIAQLGNACRERTSHFAVYFSAGFSNKTVPCTMNELYLREDFKIKMLAQIWVFSKSLWSPPLTFGIFEALFSVGFISSFLTHHKTS